MEWCYYVGRSNTCKLFPSQEVHLLVTDKCTQMCGNRQHRTSRQKLDKCEMNNKVT